MSCEVFDELRPVEPGLPFGCLDESFARKRFACQKDGIDTASLVFIVVTFQASSFTRERGASLFDELSRRFIHADHGKLRVVGTFIYIENLFHGGDKTTICLGRNDPSLLLPGFYFVFLKPDEWSHRKCCRHNGVPLPDQLRDAMTTVQTLPAARSS